MERYKFSITSCIKDYWKIRKAITAGYFFHVAKKVYNLSKFRIQQKDIELWLIIIKFISILVVVYSIKVHYGVSITS